MVRAGPVRTADPLAGVPAVTQHRIELSEAGEHKVRAGVGQLRAVSRPVHSDDKPETACDACLYACDGVFKDDGVGRFHTKVVDGLEEHRSVGLALQPEPRDVGPVDDGGEHARQGRWRRARPGCCGSR